MEPITSTRNERVRAVAALARRKIRDAEDRYLVEGPNAVGEALRDGAVETLLVTPDLVDDYRPVDVDVLVVADHVLAHAADSRTPQGVLAVARKRHADLDEVVGRGFLVVLHEAADPGNAGAIVRTADAAGAAGVVFTNGSVDPYNPKAVRASAGSLTHLPVVTGVDLGEVLTAARQAGQRVVGLSADATTTIDEPGILTAPVALVFGSEAHGLPADVVAELDDLVAVPIYGRAESLNLAAAVAVSCYRAASRPATGPASAPADRDTT